MKILQKIVTVCLIHTTLLCSFMGCSANGCAMVDNETPIEYGEPTDKEVTFEDTGYTYDVFSFACECLSSDQTNDYCYEVFAEHFGCQPLREYKNACYYTVYPLENNRLLYLFWDKKGSHYVLESMDWGDFRDDDRVQDCVSKKDLPSAILGDRKPDNCYLDYYSQEEIDRRNALIWEDYHTSIEAAGLGAISQTDPTGKASVLQVRCLQQVAFDVSKADYVYWGAYIYDIYTYQDGTGSLYFYHYLDKYESGKTVYECLQKESIDLSKEEISSLTSLLETWDFANYPTWNPEELSGMDGETTLIYAQGPWGENLISMWSASECYPHYQIRTVIENIVRSHITVNEGSVYCEE